MAIHVFVFTPKALYNKAQGQRRSATLGANEKIPALRRRRYTTGLYNAFGVRATWGFSLPRVRFATLGFGI